MTSDDFRTSCTWALFWLLVIALYIFAATKVFAIQSPIWWIAVTLASLYGARGAPRSIKDHFRTSRLQQKDETVSRLQHAAFEKGELLPSTFFKEIVDDEMDVGRSLHDAESVLMAEITAWGWSEAKRLPPIRTRLVPRDDQPHRIQVASEYFWDRSGVEIRLPSRLIDSHDSKRTLEWRINRPTLLSSQPDPPVTDSTGSWWPSSDAAGSPARGGTIRRGLLSQV